MCRIKKKEKFWTFFYCYLPNFLVKMYIFSQIPGGQRYILCGTKNGQLKEPSPSCPSALVSQVRTRKDYRSILIAVPLLLVQKLLSIFIRTIPQQRPSACLPPLFYLQKLFSPQDTGKQWMPASYPYSVDK